MGAAPDAAIRSGVVGGRGGALAGHLWPADHSHGGDGSGFDGRASRATLATAGIANGMCPRSPRELAKRLQEPAFRAQQRRRAQTEGRIAIVKQTLLGGRLRTKGYAHHAGEVAWTILAHNLWVLARLPVATKHLLAA